MNKRSGSLLRRINKCKFLNVICGTRPIAEVCHFIVGLILYSLLHCIHVLIEPNSKYSSNAASAESLYQNLVKIRILH